MPDHETVSLRKNLDDLTLKDVASNGTSTATTPIPGSFDDIFRAFAKFGDPKSDGRQITLSNSDKWMKHAKIIDGTTGRVTTTDTGICFKKLKQQKVGRRDYERFLEDLARYKCVPLIQIKDKMTAAGPPLTCPNNINANAAKKIDATVSRLTDTSKYTGTHKQRFDATGRGRGLAGRRDN